MAWFRSTGKRTTRVRAREALTGLVVLAVLGSGLGACGQGSGTSEASNLNVGYSTFPDSLDPGYSVTTEGWTVLYNTYLPLLTYAHADGTAGTEVVPALAERLPRISNHGTSYLLSLRPGLKYSDGRSISASDFKFTIERLFRANSSGSLQYTNIVGAERFAKTTEGRIDGIEANDATGEIRIDLVEPDGTFAAKLALPYAAPLPQGTDTGDQTLDPPPASGPYEITDVEHGRSWRYRRNPVWAEVNSRAMPDLPGGHFRNMDFSVFTNPAVLVHEVERGRIDLMKTPPPPDLYSSVRRRYGGTQFRVYPTMSTFYFWMNTRRPPFDQTAVRRAVNLAVDPAALERIYAGAIRSTQQILPPGMPGYRKFELYPHDPARAQRLMSEAGPDDREITIWTINEAPTREAAEYYESVLQSLGFQTRLRPIHPATFFSVIGNASTPDLDTGSSNWFLEYPHPNSFLGPQLTGAAIAAVNNTNYARFDDPALTNALKRLNRERLGPRQEAEYAVLDEAFMKRAPWVPYGTLAVPVFVSEAIDLNEVVVSPVYGSDLTSLQVDGSGD